jgi:hypothetical protein
MPDSTGELFFQFELCLLSMRSVDGDLTGIPEHIMGYAIMEHGRREAGDLTKAELLKAAKSRGSENLPSDMKLTTRDDLLYAYGQKLLGIAHGSVELAKANWTAASNVVGRHASAHGRDATVRIKKDLLFDVRDGGISWRDFSTLCAVYSLIGAKPYPVLIHRSMVIARQLGFKSPAIMNSELPARDDLTPLTEKQVRLTLDSLEIAGWFARIQASRRCVYFSHRLTREEMEAKLISKAMIQGRAVLNRTKDAGIQSKIKTAKAGKRPL